MPKGKIFVDKCQLNLKMILEGGQCFRWKGLSENDWIGTVSGVVWELKQSDEHIEYCVRGGSLANTLSKPHLTPLHNPYHEFLENYFRLEEPLDKYYLDWGKKDPNFQKLSQTCYGIRILNQDPLENVFSFICSSNNNIKRISGMVEKLCKLYGQKICDYDGEEYFSFPDISALANSKEADLRNAGFGYRAKFITQTAKELNNLGGGEWLKELKNKPYMDARKDLMQFPGIGAKVADCICLMSLGHMEALPVDTHVYQIARQTYIPHLRKVKNLTDGLYNEIGNYFRNLYGPLAGWAHTILFCGDLKAFKNLESKQLEEVPDPPNKRVATNGKGSEPDYCRKILKNGIKSVSGTLKCLKTDLHLRITLNSGQTYRFKEVEEDVWRGVFGSKVWILRQYDDHIQYTAHFPIVSSASNKKEMDSCEEEDIEYCEKLLIDYFRLDFPLKDYYKKWSDSDAHFKSVATKFYGLRMIKQDIVENLFTFICSSNNTINRMTSMVLKMSSLYGQKIAQVGDEIYFDFPTVAKLSEKSVEEELRKANFGFRAKYIQKTAEYIMNNGGEIWFEELKCMTYEQAKIELMKLPGIASKVADCICLTALGHLDTIPVDTHVFQIAKQYYLPHLKDKKSITAETYKEIGSCFRKIFGKYSGWAHTVLFCSDLRMHQNL